MLIAVIAVLAIFATVVLLACCKVSGDCARQEEEKHPCGTCVRWYEYNGVDDDCPRRNADGK